MEEIAWKIAPPILAAISIHLLTSYSRRKKRTKDFGNSLEKYLSRVKAIQVSEIMEILSDDTLNKEEKKKFINKSKLNSRRMVMTISDSFGDDFKVSIGKYGDTLIAQDCWVCRLPYTKKEKKCVNCKIECYAWEGKKNPQFDLLNTYEKNIK